MPGVPDTPVASSAAHVRRLGVFRPTMYVPIENKKLDRTGVRRCTGGGAWAPRSPLRQPKRAPPGNARRARHTPHHATVASTASRTPLATSTDDGRLDIRMSRVERLRHGLALGRRQLHRSKSATLSVGDQEHRAIDDNHAGIRRLVAAALTRPLHRAPPCRRHRRCPCTRFRSRTWSTTCPAQADTAHSRSLVRCQPQPP